MGKGGTCGVEGVESRVWGLLQGRGGRVQDFGIHFEKLMDLWVSFNTEQ